MTKSAHLLREDALRDLAVSLCPDCHGTRRRDMEGEMWDCDCSVQFARRLGDAEFPAAFDGIALGDTHWEYVLPEDTRAMLLEYVANLDAYLDESMGLILLGPVGSGKTHVAIGFAKLAIAHGYDALFINAPAWFQELRESYAESSSAERDLMREMKDAPILILDDLGAEKPSDWMRERLYLVVNHRVLSGAVTIVTTNAPLEQLEHNVGERVMSRLYGNALTLSLASSDYRRKEREERLARVRQRVNTAAESR